MFYRINRFFCCFWSVMAALLLVTGCSDSAGPPLEPQYPIYTLSVPLTAQQVVPQTDSTKSGTASVVAKSEDYSLEISMNVAEFPNLTGLQVTFGYAGINGSYSVELEASADPSIYVYQGTLTEALFTQLVAGRAYIELITSDYPAGEIRGQILTSNVRMEMVNMSGLQVRPTSVTTDLEGIAYITINSADNQLVAKAWLNEADRATEIWLMQGAATVNGSPVQNLSIDDEFHPLSWELWELSYILADAQMTAVDEGHLYVNLYSSLYPEPSGEIRGQIPAK